MVAFLLLPPFTQKYTGGHSLGFLVCESENVNSGQSAEEHGFNYLEELRVVCALTPQKGWCLLSLFKTTGKAASMLAGEVVTSRER